MIAEFLIDAHYEIVLKIPPAQTANGTGLGQDRFDNKRKGIAHLHKLMALTYAILLSDEEGIEF